MSTKVQVEIPTRSTNVGSRLFGTNTPIDGTEKIAESVNEIDDTRLPIQSHASSYHGPRVQGREPDAVAAKSLSRDSPLSDLDTSTDDDLNQIPSGKKSNTTSVLVSRASAKKEWPAIAKRLGHKSRDHGEIWRDYQTRVLQNLGSHLLKGPKRLQEIARLAMDSGEYAHMVAILDPTDYGAGLKNQGEPKAWRIENADLSAWGVEPIQRPVPCQRCADAGIPCMFTNSHRPNNETCRLCSVKFSRCDGTTPKRKRPVAKQPEPTDHRVCSTSSGKRKSRGETSQGTLTSSKKHKAGSEDVIWVSGSSPSTPSLPPSATTTAKSIPTLISELWNQETKRYEARIQELQKQEHNSASLFEAYRREVQAAKQQSADFQARNELLEGEIATLKAENVRLEERVGATRKVLEGLKSKFLVKVIQATDEIMTGFDELGAQ